MLAFFPNRLDLPDRVMANLLVGVPTWSYYDYFQGWCTRGSVYYLASKPG
jgi:hypothetical protein